MPLSEDRAAVARGELLAAVVPGRAVGAAVAGVAEAQWALPAARDETYDEGQGRAFMTRTSCLP